MSLNKKNIMSDKEFIFLGPPTVIIIVFLFIFSGRHTKMHDLALEALSQQTPQQGSYLWWDIQTSFEQDEYQNVAISTSGKKQVVRTDTNKTRILGNLAAQKSKEFIKGWVDGRESEGKHGDDNFRAEEVVEKEGWFFKK